MKSLDEMNFSVISKLDNVQICFFLFFLYIGSICSMMSLNFACSCWWVDEFETVCLGILLNLQLVVVTMSAIYHL